MLAHNESSQHKTNHAFNRQIDLIAIESLIRGSWSLISYNEVI